MLMSNELISTFFLIEFNLIVFCL